MQKPMKQNKARRWIYLLGIALIAAAVPSIIPITKTSNRGMTATLESTSVPQRSEVTIDGKLNPDLIPDVTAYSLFFRFLSGRQIDDERSSVLAYLRHFGFDSTEATAVLAVAKEFDRRIEPLDRQVKEIKDLNWPNPSLEVMTHLTELQQQKERLVKETIASLPARLNSSTYAKLQRHINDRVKRKTIISSGPNSPPGGPDWQYHAKGQEH